MVINSFSFSICFLRKDISLISFLFLKMNLGSRSRAQSESRMLPSLMLPLRYICKRYIILAVDYFFSNIELLVLMVIYPIPANIQTSTISFLNLCLGGYIYVKSFWADGHCLEKQLNVQILNFFFFFFWKKRWWVISSWRQ